MRALLAAVLVLALLVPAMASITSREDMWFAPGPGYQQHDPDVVWGGARDVLWDNGPLMNYEPDQSMLQDATLGMGTYGFGHQFYYENWMAEDFTIPEGDMWNIETITFFAYQTGSTLTSTFTAYHVVIYDGPPFEPTSTVVFGDVTTDVLQASGWSGVYRTLESAPGGTNRPIMANICEVVVTLGPGTYYAIWQADGTLDSGPWAPPIVIWNQAETGDGWQSVDNGVTWEYADDSSGSIQGFPFIVEGMHSTPVENTSWTSIKALYR
ncbi:hypothetical protein K8S17_05185 [bacterium]|nr:hypothetical protein [bacterium]